MGRNLLTQLLGGVRGTVAIRISKHGPVRLRKVADADAGFDR